MAVGAVLDGTRDERLLFAVACSLVLHLGLLYLPSTFFESTRKPKPAALNARLVEQKAPEAPKLAPEPAPELPKPVPKVVRPPVHKPAPRAHAPITPPVIAVPQAPATPPAATAIPSPAPQPATPPAAAAAPAKEATPSASAAPDPGSLARFRMDLIEIAKRYKRYPRAAVDNNWEGRVDLRMVVAANGQIASLSVRKSAGFAALDDEAQRMFRTAKGEVAIPPALRGKEFTVDVAADFYFTKE